MKHHKSEFTSTKYATLGKILTVLEELDRFSFDSSTKDSCMDVLHKKVWATCLATCPPRTRTRPWW